MEIWYGIDVFGPNFSFPDSNNHMPVVATRNAHVTMYTVTKSIATLTIYLKPDRRS